MMDSSAMDMEMMGSINRLTSELPLMRDCKNTHAEYTKRITSKMDMIKNACEREYKKFGFFEEYCK